METVKTAIRIIIADDHEIFREGLRSMFEKQNDIILLAEAANGQQLVTLTGIYHPDVILTDIKMPVMDGIEATTIIAARYPLVGILALSMFDHENLIIDMLEAGAKGYLIKNAPKTEVLDAVKTVAKNNPYYCSSTSIKMAQLIAESRFKPAGQSGRIIFSTKEIEIIKLICCQLPNKEIAAQLHLSIRTIESYRERILQKTNARNTVGIVVYAISHNIFTPGQPS